MLKSVCIVALVTVAGGIVPGQVGADEGQRTLIHGCVKNGTLRIVEPAQECEMGETLLHWPAVIDGNVGIGLSPEVATPGQRLHLGDGNILLEGGGETAVQFKRDITFEDGESGDSPNPIFQLGRLERAGDGDPEFRLLYEDDDIRRSCPPARPECARSVLKVDRKGIVASVKPDRGSHFEAFLEPVTDGVPKGEEEPLFRLNSHPAMQFEMGPGGKELTDVIIRRAGPNTISILMGNGANAIERLRIGPDGVQVVSSYLQLSTVSGGAPPASDCDSAAHAGRIVIRTDGPPGIYACLGAGGWVRR